MHFLLCITRTSSLMILRKSGHCVCQSILRAGPMQSPQICHLVCCMCSLCRKLDIASVCTISSSLPRQAGLATNMRCEVCTCGQQGSTLNCVAARSRMLTETYATNRNNCAPVMLSSKPMWLHSSLTSRTSPSTCYHDFGIAVARPGFPSFIVNACLLACELKDSRIHSPFLRGGQLFFTQISSRIRSRTKKLCTHLNLNPGLKKQLSSMPHASKVRV